MKNVIGLATYLLFSTTVFAQNFQTQSVSIFKNGQSFFIKNGQVKTTDGQWKMLEQDVPAALFGTLWFHSSEGAINSTKSYPDTLISTKEETAAVILDVLKLNQGKQMILHLKNDKTLTGTIESITKTQNAEDTKNRYNHLARVVVFKTETQWITFLSGDIQRIDFLEQPNFMMKTTEKLPKNIIEIGFENKEATQNLEMMYLRNGLNWSPEYLLELNSDTEAKLTLQAEIANNGEDLEQVDLNLVIGVPNFKFATQAAMLVNFMKEIRQSSNRNNHNNFSNVSMGQSSSYGVNSDFQGNAAPPEAVAGSANGDLFFYNLPQFSLPKGGRAMQELFAENVNIAHIYECNLTANPTAGYRKEYLFTAPTSNNVIHSVKVTNKTTQPWTTGSVFVVNQDGKTRPVSQDMLNYTPSKGHTFIKLTEAPDVKIEQAEKEISRQPKAKLTPQKNGYWYDLVKVEGQIKIRNYKDKAIDLNVRRPINGTLGNSSIEWLKEEVINRNNNLNALTNVCWETTLEGGKELIIKYNYEIYVRF